MAKSILATLLMILLARLHSGSAILTQREVPPGEIAPPPTEVGAQPEGETSTPAKNSASRPLPEDENTRNLAERSETFDLYPPPERASDANPAMRAEASIVLDERTDTVIYAKNEHTPLPIASITKLMVAMVVLDAIPDVTRVHTVDEPKRIGSNMALEEGEQLTIRKLLAGSLIASANDASQQLAIAVAGSEEAFVKMMNDKARELHLEHTAFSNITGLDREEDPSIRAENVSTVFELAQLVDHSRNYELIWDFVDIERLTVSSQDGTIIHELEATNKLLGTVRGLEGGKTGFTDRAGQSLVTVTKRNGDAIIAAVLNSPDRFGEMERLIDWTYANTTWNHCTQEELCDNLK